MTIWLLPALVCYAIASVLFAVEFSSRVQRVTGYAVSALAAGAVFHALDLVGRGLQAGNIPVGNFTQALSFLAWVTALAGLILIVRLRIAVVGALVSPSVLIALGASEAMAGEAGALPNALRSMWLPVHVTLAFAGEALFVLAATVSLVYLFQESRLKGHRPLLAGPGGMPSLEKLDRINYRLLGWGFLLLTLAILSGALWAEHTWGRFWSWEPRELWSLITWLLYAALLESRLTVGWRGRRAATLTIVVFAVLVGSFVGVSLIHPGKHGGSFG
ncbi:MAG TPA: c-type cytochrome biogenesis protein CcsB [Candidatus Binataceae bacterium]|nr:c-type cytochrome biogenesis protein CcsB [Candidatus Binataceae bacterium]